METIPYPYFSFFNESKHLPKHMVVVFTTGPPTSIMTSSTLYYHPAIESPESLDHFSIRNEHRANCQAEHNTALSKALQAKHNNFHNLVGAMLYKLLKNRELSIDEHVHQRQDATIHLKEHWSEYVAISAQYHYKERVIHVPSQFQSTWDGHLDASTLQSIESSCSNQTQHQYT